MYKETKDIRPERAKIFQKYNYVMYIVHSIPNVYALHDYNKVDINLTRAESLTCSRLENFLLTMSKKKVPVGSGKS